MRIFLSATVLATSLLAVPAAYSQTLTEPNPAALQGRQNTDGDLPTIVGPGSKAYSQKTDGDGPAMNGPGSKAYSQKTDGDGPAMIGPGSKAFSN